MKKALLILILFSTIVFAENYKQVKVFVKGAEDILQLQKLGVVDDHFIYDRQNSITFFTDETQYQKLMDSQFSYEILINDWSSHYKSRSKADPSELERQLNDTKRKYNVTGFDYGSMGGYLTADEVYAKLDEMTSEYPNLITSKYSIGQSLEGREIYAIKISDNPNVDEDEPEVFFNSLIHAREPQGMMGLIYYMYYLLENYGIDDEVTYLVNNREIYFVPIINIDGFEYNRTTDPNGGGMWRKNRRQNSGGYYGVDLNRNWGYKWGYDNSGSSNDPSDETYRGTAPFSEPTNQVIRDFVIDRNFKAALNYHTYSNLLIVPYGYENIETPDSLIFREYAAEMTKYNNYAWGTSSDLLYAVNGSTDDWMYGEQSAKDKIISMTPEVGNSSDGFWPLQNRIIPLAEENIHPNLFLTWASGGFPKLENVNFSQQYFNPGETFSIQPTIKNIGLDKIENISVSVSSISEAISVAPNNAVNIASIPSRETVQLPTPLNVTLDNLAQVDDEAKFLINFSKDGITLRNDTISIRIGVPQAVFTDLVLDESDYWSFNSNDGVNWEKTSNSYYSSPYSYTDSKNGNYASYLLSSMTLKNSISLAGLARPILSFRSKWNIESDWDCGQVLISTNNGSSWTSVGGNYSSPASGSGTQSPSGIPVYDGNQSNWIDEQIDLSQYSGTNILIRFELQSDSYIEYDGWYVDDIKVLYYQIVPVELTSFTVNNIDDKIILNWETATELNNNGFEIRRSKDKTNWQLLGFKEGKGTTSEITKYTFVDEQPLSGKSFYKLTQIDYDGKVNEVGNVEFDNLKNISFSLEQNYPNPFNPITSIEFSVPSSEYVNLKIYDVLGNEIAQLINEQKQAGTYDVEFNASNLPSGIYYYRLKAGNMIQSKKMMLIK